MPGVLTPTEAFTALRAGARHLKLFPATSAGPRHLAALGEVLPPDARVWAVGGVAADNLGEWLAAGACGVAVGSALYRPGRSPGEIRDRAAALVAAWQRFRDVRP
jgi:2-dehydro-3-deoxyphosphogalactonate aldolase